MKLLGSCIRVDVSRAVSVNADDVKCNKGCKITKGPFKRRVRQASESEREKQLALSLPGRAGKITSFSLSLFLLLKKKRVS